MLPTLTLKRNGSYTLPNFELPTHWSDFATLNRVQVDIEVIYLQLFANVTGRHRAVHTLLQTCVKIWGLPQLGTRLEETPDLLETRERLYHSAMEGDGRFVPNSGPCSWLAPLSQASLIQFTKRLTRFVSISRSLPACAF